MPHNSTRAQTNAQTPQIGPTLLVWLRRMLLPVALLALSQLSWADIEATGPDGKRYLLKVDGSWQEIDPKSSDPTQSKSPPDGEAEMQLIRRVERASDCQLVVRLTNKMTYQIQHIVPTFSVYRSTGVLHDTASAVFGFVRPTENSERTVSFSKIRCDEIAHVQVGGADRCEMGDLNKFTDGKGLCLARVRVLPSDLVRFDK